MKIGDIKRLLVGKAKNPMDPKIFHRLSLIALLAWVGLGADGLTSSCYGPEEAFIGLGQYGFLSIYLAIATGLTITVIALSYNQIIEQFPFGGGGYMVATKLISPSAGLVAGSALVIDYILTIAVSVASGIDALFSFMPADFQAYKLICSIAVIFILTFLNLRGVKESVTILFPIFAVFILTHLVMIGSAVFQSTATLPAHLSQTIPQTQDMMQKVGVWALILILLKAYSHGAGTYTGIEAVSNALPTLREPKVQTGKTTMVYMAISLAVLAGSLLIFYGIFKVAREPGQTLNASLFEKIVLAWNSPFGHWLVVLTLISEGLLLFVAAQTGFVGGPSVLSNMALDQWMPKRFSHLSEQLTISNGIIFMGLSSIIIVIVAQGSVAYLVVLYSINVFITFTLSQFGMCRHWLQVRRKKEKWAGKFSINLIGLLLTTTVLAMMLIFKFKEGGWLTLIITSALVICALLIKKHYKSTQTALKRLNELLKHESTSRPEKCALVNNLNKDDPTGVILVSSFSGYGLHTFFSVNKLFPKVFKRFIFISVGELDTGKFKGVSEVENLRAATENSVNRYVRMANDYGFCAESKFDVSVDTIETLIGLCSEVQQKYPNSVFFLSKLVFKNENIFTHMLHNETAFRLQRQLALGGKQTVLMPIRVY